MTQLKISISGLFFGVKGNDIGFAFMSPFLLRPNKKVSSFIDENDQVVIK